MFVTHKKREKPKANLKQNFTRKVHNIFFFKLHLNLVILAGYILVTKVVAGHLQKGAQMLLF